MARLSLPPTHLNFPHPSLLHAICASTARFVGGLALVPPSATLFVQSPQAQTNKNQLLGQPAWDGLSGRPAATTKGLDEDFGQIHASWAQLYVDQVSRCSSEHVFWPCKKTPANAATDLTRPSPLPLFSCQARHDPAQWLEATQALLLISYYSHQHGLWLKAWSAVGSMVR